MSSQTSLLFLFFFFSPGVEQEVGWVVCTWSSRLLACMRLPCLWSTLCCSSMCTVGCGLSWVAQPTLQRVCLIAQTTTAMSPYTRWEVTTGDMRDMILFMIHFWLPKIFFKIFLSMLRHLSHVKWRSESNV